MESLFNDNGTINDRRHKHDHSELGEMLERRQRNRQLVEKVKTSVVVGGVVFFFTTLGSIVWYAAKAFVGVHK